MITCFLFYHHFDKENCLSLCLDAEGNIAAPLELRTLDEIRVLQVNARTIVVLSSEISSLYELELPKLSEQKIRAAVPFALEEQLAQPVSTLHFAFDAKRYENNRYLVAAIDRQYLLEVMKHLTAMHLVFHAITLDWMALDKDQTIVTSSNLLIASPDFKGALSVELAPMYITSPHGKTTTVLLFSDSASVAHLPTTALQETSSLLWIAKRLLNTHPLNLCQGELRHTTKQSSHRRWYLLSALFAGFWLLSLLIIHGVTLHALSAKNADLNQEIAIIYHDFFPDAKHVISPRFRISQFLKEHATNQDMLWTLLNKLATASAQQPLHFQQLRFQNQTLLVTLSTKDFSDLERFQQRLEQQHLKAKQMEAATHDQNVVATLELSL